MSLHSLTQPQPSAGAAASLAGPHPSCPPHSQTQGCSGQGHLEPLEPECPPGTRTLVSLQVLWRVLTETARQESAVISGDPRAGQTRSCEVEQASCRVLACSSLDARSNPKATRTASEASLGGGAVGGAQGRPRPGGLSGWVDCMDVRLSRGFLPAPCSSDDFTDHLLHTGCWGMSAPTGDCDSHLIPELDPYSVCWPCRGRLYPRCCSAASPSPSLSF